MKWPKLYWIILMPILFYLSCTKTGINKQPVENSNAGYTPIYTQISKSGNFTEYIQTDSIRPAGLNPFSYPTCFRYTAPNSCDVKIDIFNIAGQKVDSADFGRRNSGSYKADWIPSEPSNIPSGAYYAKFLICDSTRTIKITLLK